MIFRAGNKDAALMILAHNVSAYIFNASAYIFHCLCYLLAPFAESLRHVGPKDSTNIG